MTSSPSKHREADSRTLRVSLPRPPSVNRIWRVYNGRIILSSEYRAWKAAAAVACADQLRATGYGAILCPGPYRLTLTAERPDRRARDLDNLPKACSDALKAAGVIRDDSDALAITVQWSEGPPRKGAEVLAEVEPA